MSGAVAVAGAAPTWADDTSDLGVAKQRAAQAAAQLQESTVAVQAAAAELARIGAELPVAQQAVSVARGQLAGAQAKAAAARAEAARAEAARRAAAAEVAAADGVVQQSRTAVASLARMAYQRGALGDLRDVIQATEPQDALERGQLLKQVFDAGTSSLDKVTSARLALAAKRAQLVAEDKAAAAARARADAEQARAEQLTQQAEAAAAKVAGLVEQQKSVLAQAQTERADDERVYQQAQQESAALAEKIRQAQAAAAAAARAAAASRGRIPAPPPVVAPGRSGWTWPAAGPITSPFGWRLHPIFQVMRFHSGLDIGADYGAPVLASKPGTVISAGWAGGSGLLVVVDNGGGIATAYAHMASIAVSAGQTVAQGQSLGEVGSTGNSTGPHLHFEVRVNGEPVDPLGYVRQP